MEGPHTRIRLGDADILLVGTVAGFAPDGERVRRAFAEHGPDAVALGVPPEDVATLKAIAESPATADLPEPDDATERLLVLLRRFGETRVPSPDLEAAYAEATSRGVPVEPLDLDDMAHAEAYTSRVKFRHVVRSNSLRRKLLQEPFDDAGDAYALATAWEGYLMRLKPLAEVEAAREEWMARRLREVAAGRRRVLAVVPVARMAGVASRLTAKP